MKSHVWYDRAVDLIGEVGSTAEKAGRYAAKRKLSIDKGLADPDLSALKKTLRTIQDNLHHLHCALVQAEDEGKRNNKA